MLDPLGKLRRLGEAEAARARAIARTTALRGVILAIAAVFAAVGLTMLALAAHALLAPRLGVPGAAAVVAGGAFVLALALIALARRAGAGERTAAEREVSAARAAIAEDVATVESFVRGLRTGRRAGPKGTGKAAEGGPSATVLALTAFAAGLALALAPRLLGKRKG